jgi:Xaa-Pro aminopeptidase
LHSKIKIFLKLISKAWLQVHGLPVDLYNYCQNQAKKGFQQGFMGLGGNGVSFVGHGIGLFVDEWPVLAENFGEPLQKNMVLALEPKIGIPDFGMVGVEGTYVVTGKGGKSLAGKALGIIYIN